MNSLIRFGLVFLALLFGFAIASSIFARNLTVYAISRCGLEPHFACAAFDIVHKWYWPIAIFLSGLVAFILAFASKRSAA